MNKATTKKAKSNALKAKPTETGKIVHRLPGRVRVRIDRLHNDIKYGDDLKQAVTALSGVTEVRINALASSIVISYHSNELPEQTVLNCLGVPFPNPEVANMDRSNASPDADFVKEAEQFTAELTSETVGESIGEVVGEAVGELLMGPVGMAIGAEIDAKIGEEVGESIGHIVEESINSESPTSSTVGAADVKEDLNNKRSPKKTPTSRHKK